MGAEFRIFQRVLCAAMCCRVLQCVRQRVAVRIAVRCSVGWAGVHLYLLQRVVCVAVRCV